MSLLDIFMINLHTAYSARIYRRDQEPVLPVCIEVSIQKKYISEEDTGCIESKCKQMYCSCWHFSSSLSLEGEDPKTE